MFTVVSNKKLRLELDLNVCLSAYESRAVAYNLNCMLLLGCKFALPKYKNKNKIFMGL
jgi:hypothetical protein